MKAGDKVVCIDDSGWLMPEVGESPVKGSVYCVRELLKFGSVAAISLVGFDPEGFYRVCRFRPVQQVNERELVEANSSPAGPSKGGE